MYEVCKFHENIPNFGKISVKISVLGSYTLIAAPLGRNGEVDLHSSTPNFTSALCAARNAAGNNHHWLKHNLLTLRLKQATVGETTL